MRKILIAAAGFAALAGAAGLAAAQDEDRPPHGPMAMFQAADANHDGVLTRQEFDVGRDAHFAQMDSNRDGALSRDEMRAMRGLRGDHRWRHGGGMHSLRGADANHDGSISRDEFLARPIEHFDRLDADHDGVISAAELPQRRERHARGEHPNLDANGDGQISSAEFAAMGEGMFERLDANHDGRLTSEEMQAAHPHRRGGE
jgi:Ca2+-binding EF-hand superfamily protein